MNEEPTVTKRCSDCGEHKPTTEFSRHSKSQDGLQWHCKSCGAEKAKFWAQSNPYKAIYHRKKSRAKSDGIPFDLEFDEIVWPSHCPVLGIPIGYSRLRGQGFSTPPNAPSFDRIDPTKGYVKGNVLIVSHRANTVKSNATVEELKRVAAFYEQLIPINQHGDYSNA